ncbi:ribosome small subunit-dependent GTPase A [Mycoplasma sp. U97]|uniref:ribosome small subunit-dependent GTPase A n=1 Tax=Mycoplasma tauri TaxID=547987 RepID=UPI001CC04D59|nr:ribosome small subunit-dependent GTPase A [Mycoplasma tauri]MBZ4204168.1 ribosome small subunit-dependent GTPase A [Mycoplasma tauri]MBZ4212566.1 ribosome small subunit-dependent GTPase A [Mycoplasma tauri]
MRGKIYSINAGKYFIKGLDGEIHILPALGIFRHKNISPLVGDYVDFEEDKYLTKIYPRTNEFIRPKVANINYIIIVMSSKEPEFSSFLVDKYMAFIECHNVEPILFITKSDLEKSKYKKMYEELGYKVYEIDNKEKKWIENIRALFNNKCNVLMGQSGVGKTTIINTLTNNNFDTQAISKGANRGKHTTRIVQIVNVFDNGELIDTPGFSSLDINFTKVELAQSFRQFKELSKICKFKDCLHMNEPENFCNVKLNVKNKIVPEFRYQNYLKLLNEVN